METNLDVYLNGMNLLKALGEKIDDPGYENDGNIFIGNLTKEKLTLIQDILEYMKVNYQTEKVYEFIYNQEFYNDTNPQTDYNLFNKHTTGMFILTKKIKQQLKRV